MIDTAMIREKAGKENYEKAISLMSGGMLREMQAEDRIVCVGGKAAYLVARIKVFY